MIYKLYRATASHKAKYKVEDYYADEFPNLPEGWATVTVFVLEGTVRSMNEEEYAVVPFPELWIDINESTEVRRYRKNLDEYPLAGGYTATPETVLREVLQLFSQPEDIKRLLDAGIYYYDKKK